jgi:DNA gyrase subunit A
MDVARDDQELLVVTENGFGKRTALAEYPVKNRGTMGVKTISLTDKKGALAGALVVREHQELVFISQGGMVQRTSVRGINRYGRASQGVKLMNLKDDDVVSAVALVVESDADTGAPVAENGVDTVAESTETAAGNGAAPDSPADA